MSKKRTPQQKLLANNNSLKKMDFRLSEQKYSIQEKERCITEKEKHLSNLSCQVIEINKVIDKNRQLLKLKTESLEVISAKYQRM